GRKKRNSRDFPAAGLRWEAIFDKGINKIEAKAWKGKVVVTDSVAFVYQAEKWGKPVKLVLQKIKEENGNATIEARMLDENGMLCLDAASFIRFGITGEGKLLDNLGTSSGARYVQLYNGRAIIKVDVNKGQSVVSVQADGIPAAFINLLQ
ncbi:MAG TPA: glycoside hydrolase family 2, partial [Chitinophagaceae bacterium]|nr:glycoside hydrolase family 2 [Chitinophagaceae bacterium]